MGDTYFAVERIKIKKKDKEFNEIKALCIDAQNLYNLCLTTIKKEYEETKNILTGFGLSKIFTREKNETYYKFPSRPAKYLLGRVHRNLNSFFSVKKRGYKAGFPKLLNKRFGVTIDYCSSAVMKSEFKLTGELRLSRTNIKIKSKFIKTVEDFQKLKIIRLVPSLDCFYIEIVREENTELSIKDNDSHAAIDLGVNNLVTLVGTKFPPVIISGKPLKSINRKYIVEVEKCKCSNWSYKKLRSLNSIRNKKVNDYLHKTSSFIVKHLVDNRVTSLTIGYSKRWKHKLKFNKKQNFNFGNIPHRKLVDLISYKCSKYGITVKEVHEGYTSKCSFLDNEEIKKHNSYLNILKLGIGEFKYPIEVWQSPRRKLVC